MIQTFNQHLKEKFNFIDNNIVICYHRTNYKDAIINNGFKLERAGVTDGSLYGKGIYNVFNLNSTLQALGNKRKIYGKTIIACKVDVSKFLIFKLQEAKQFYKDNFALTSQYYVLELFDVETEKEDIKNFHNIYKKIQILKKENDINAIDSLLNNLKGFNMFKDLWHFEKQTNDSTLPTQFSYRYFVKNLPSTFPKGFESNSLAVFCNLYYYQLLKKVDGIVYKGGIDGDCIVSWKEKNTIPFKFFDDVNYDATYSFLSNDSVWTFLTKNQIENIIKTKNKLQIYQSNFNNLIIPNVISPKPLTAWKDRKALLKGISFNVKKDRYNLRVSYDILFKTLNVNDKKVIDFSIQNIEYQKFDKSNPNAVILESKELYCNILYTFFQFYYHFYKLVVEYTNENPIYKSFFETIFVNEITFIDGNVDMSPKLFYDMFDMFNLQINVKQGENSLICEVVKNLFQFYEYAIDISKNKNIELDSQKEKIEIGDVIQTNEGFFILNTLKDNDLYFTFLKDDFLEILPDDYKKIQLKHKPQYDFIYSKKEKYNFKFNVKLEQPVLEVSKWYRIGVNDTINKIDNIVLGIEKQTLNFLNNNLYYALKKDLPLSNNTFLESPKNDNIIKSLKEIKISNKIQNKIKTNEKYLIIDSEIKNDIGKICVAFDENNLLFRNKIIKFNNIIKVVSL